MMTDNRGLLAALIGDGRGPLKLTAISLIGAGLFAIFLSATGHFLPHDIAFLGMTAEQMHSIADARVAHFMFHDRVSFGGAIIGVGTLYLWLAEFPLSAREPWAWWTFLISGVLGFSSFLAYLGYGYLDTWHGAATLVLIPIFCVGMVKSRAALRPLPSLRGAMLDLPPTVWRSAYGAGRVLLLITALCLVLGGLIITGVGMTTVFVPQDLEFMGVQRADLQAINPHLIPLIAHDRAGFGGGVCCCGVTMFLCVLRGTPSRSLWQALLVMGLAGFGTAIGVHFPIGYINLFHLSPAILGAVMFGVGMLLTCDRMMEGERS
ncbi:MAG: hypothetical protein K8T25_18335 [Planctomycetia bacterium]|nr:hypothetical protein [Planctomycetia bacterium]